MRNAASVISGAVFLTDLFYSVLFLGIIRSSFYQNV